MSFHCLLPKIGGHTDWGVPPICTLNHCVVQSISMMQYGVRWCNGNNGVHVEVHYGIIRRNIRWYNIHTYVCACMDVHSRPHALYLRM